MKHVSRLLSQIFVWLFPKRKTLRPKRATKQRIRKHSGVHYYLGDLLDNMDHYHRVMREVKRWNPNDYDYFSRVGVSICSSDWQIEKDANPHLRLGHLPSKMGIHLNIDNDNNRVYLGLLTFTKMNFVPGVQYSNNSIYSAVMYWDDMSGKYKTVIGEPFYISVNDNGGIEVLREYSEVMETPRKRKTNRRPMAIPTRRWRVPRPLLWLKQEWAKSSQYKADYGKNPTVGDVAEYLFLLCYNAFEATHHGLQVQAKKSGIAATFAIEMLRTPYFFQNREKVVTESGRTKPIFHIVRTHKRKTGSFVRSHFRGLRRFNWGGHDVTIILPSRSIFGFSATAWDAEELQKVEKRDVGYDSRKLATKMAGYLTGGFKNEHLKREDTKEKDG